jgi:hypothetical protein
MSGGHFNGQEYALRNIADQIREEHDALPHTDQGLCEHLANKCDILFEEIRKLDYYLEGDVSFKEFYDHMCGIGKFYASHEES